jgi:hypothetical protein
MKTTIDQLIINSPYEEPKQYWSYDRETRTFNRKEGRRPAGYVIASESSKAFDDPGIFIEIPLVNKIRQRVKAWREHPTNPYAGVPDAKNYKSKLYHIYNDSDVKDDINRKAEEHEPLPDLVINGYHLLGKDWLETRHAWIKAAFTTPPDFIIRLKNGTYLILETKGQDTQQDKTKREFLDEWVKAVNAHGGFGRWQWAVSKNPADVKGLVEKAAKK